MRDSSTRASSEAMSEAKLQSLAGLAGRGDRQAMTEIYTLLARRVFGLCRRLLGSREAAEDATSEVFLRVQRSLMSDAGSGGYDPALPFPRWLLSIAGHYCVDQLRRRGLETRIFPPSGEEQGVGTPSAVDTASASWTSTPETSPLDRILAREDREGLRAALDRLPERSRLILTLRYSSEMSYDQIAAALGMTRNLVATLIFRAKAELRRTLSAGAAKEQGA